MRDWICAWLPLLSWLPTYPRDWLRLDIVAGLTAAAVVVPKAMAYATVAGLPLQVGLYTAFIPMVVYALLGTSRPLSVSTTTTIAILTGAELAVAVPDGDPALLLQATVLLSLMVGAMLVLASVLRLGFTANFISEPVLIGFKAGIGIVIVVDQVPKLLGIKFDKGNFLQNLAEIVRALPDSSVPTVLVGFGTMIALLLIAKWRPKWPAPIIVVAACIAGASFWPWQEAGIKLVGEIPTGLPSLGMPLLSIDLMLQMWPAAAGIALMSFAETIAVGRAFVGDREPMPRPNIELAATGAGNLVGAFFGAMPSGGGASQTAVARQAGAMTPIAALVTALMTLLVMFLLAPYIGAMPQATLAGVVIVYSVGLIGFAEIRTIYRVRRTEFLWAVAALLGVLMIGTLQGILVAIIVSIIALGQQVANPPVHVLVRKPGTTIYRPKADEHPHDESVEGLLILRPEGRLFFLNAERVAETMRELLQAHQPRAVLLDLGGVFDLEYTALSMLVKAEQLQRERGVQVLIAAPNEEVLAMLVRSPLGEHIPRTSMFYNVETAVGTYLAQTGRRRSPD